MAGELADVVGGAVIATSFTNDVKDRTVMRYANAAARDAAIPSPVAGDIAFITDTKTITYYTGGIGPEWLTLATV